MVEGQSGLLAISARGRRPRFEPSRRRLTWPNGAQAFLFSAAEPESLRGPQHSHSWCDEIAKWDMASGRAMQAYDNLLMGLRLGDDPRLLATTTPRTVPLVQRMMAQIATGDCVLTKGSTYDNAANLPPRFLNSMRRQFGKTPGSPRRNSTSIKHICWPIHFCTRWSPGLPMGRPSRPLKEKAGSSALRRPARGLTIPMTLPPMPVAHGLS